MLPQQQTCLTIRPASEDTTNSLPQHDEFSLVRRTFSVVSILSAVGLLVVQTRRVILSIDEFHWSIPLAVVAGALAADFLSGLVHWAADTWGSESMPIIGRRLLHPFRVHHVNPDDFLRRRFIDTNGDVAFIVVPILAAACLLPLATAADLACAVFVTAFCAVGLLTNQTHQWAHMANPPLPVRALQKSGVILGRRAHAQHHFPPYVDHYCIATGWCNWPLTAIDFFRRLERLVSRVTGHQPRHDEEVFRADVQARAQVQRANDLAVEQDRAHES